MIPQKTQWSTATVQLTPWGRIVEDVGNIIQRQNEYIYIKNKRPAHYQSRHRRLSSLQYSYYHLLSTKKLGITYLPPYQLIAKNIGGRIVKDVRNIIQRQNEYIYIPDLTVHCLDS